jgi:GntR family transcriptional regulator, transcriptional repressor for pyruvate dehydrogenase complex
MLKFKPAQNIRVFQDVILQIEEAIIKGDLGVGAKLPSERELQTKFQTSRATIREALRVLEQKGLLKIKKGSAGGSFVEQTSGAKIGESLELLIRLGEVTLTQLFEFRSNIEAMAFESAVHKATDTDIKKLKKKFIKLEKAYGKRKNHLDIFFKIELELHEDVLALSQNPLYEWVLGTIIATTWKIMHMLPHTENAMESSLLDWRDIIEAIENGNTQKASTVIRSHLLNYYRIYQQYLRDNQLDDQTVAQAIKSK